VKSKKPKKSEKKPRGSDLPQQPPATLENGANSAEPTRNEKNGENQETGETQKGSKKARRSRKKKSGAKNGPGTGTGAGAGAAHPDVKSKKPKTGGGGGHQKPAAGGEEVRQAAIEQSLPHWLAHPQQIDADIAGGLAIGELQERLQRLNQTEISPRTLRVLGEHDVVRFFPVQGVVIPAMMKDCTTFSHPGDLCVSAPTGSGKTLAYAIPIVEVLAKRVVTRLRALVILPTRELVAQVLETFTMLTKGTDLKILCATGHTRFHQEQRQLVSNLDKE